MLERTPKPQMSSNNQEPGHHKSAALRCTCLFMLLVLVMTSGCAIETIVKKSAPVEPDWLYRTKKSDGELAYYVGRSLSENILDEKGAMDEALNNAASQIARTIYTEVDNESRWVDGHQGDEVLGLDKRYSSWRNIEKVEIDSIVSGLRPVETYFEKWRVRENIWPWSHKVYKYKYFVLVSYPETKLQGYVNQVKKKWRTSGRY